MQKNLGETDGMQIDTVRSSLLNIMRAFGAFVLLVWGWGWIGSLRTMSVGFSWGRVFEEAIVAAVCVLPLAALLFLGLPKWRYGCALLLAVVVPVFLAEVWAGVEEMRFKQVHRGEKTGPRSRVVFEKNWIAYNPATGELSGGD